MKQTLYLEYVKISSMKSDGKDKTNLVEEIHKRLENFNREEKAALSNSDYPYSTESQKCLLKDLKKKSYINHVQNIEKDACVINLWKTGITTVNAYIC